MPYIKLKPTDNFEIAFRRYKKSCEKSGLFAELKKREHFEKTGIKKKKKSIAARKRAMKKQRSF